MKLWYKKSSLFILAGISYLVGQYFRGVWFLGSSIPNVCGHAEAGGISFCNSPYSDTFGTPLIVLGQTLAIVALILLLANESAFRKWLHFSYWYVPLSAWFVIYMTPFPLVPMAMLYTDRAVYDLGVVWQYVTAGIVILYILKFLKRQLRERRLRKIKARESTDTH